MPNFIDSKRFSDAKEQAENAVSTAYGLDRGLIEERSKSKYACILRHAVWFYLRKKYKFTLKSIAELYGYDHTTVRYGINKSEANKAQEMLKNCLHPVDTV